MKTKLLKQIWYSRQFNTQNCKKYINLMNHIECLTMLQKSCPHLEIYIKSSKHLQNTNQPLNLTNTNHKSVSLKMKS